LKNVILTMGLEPVLVPPIVAFAKTLHEQGFEVRVVFAEVKGMDVSYALPFAQLACVLRISELSFRKKLSIPARINRQVRSFTDSQTAAVFCFDPISLQSIHRGLARKLKVFYWQFELYGKERTRRLSLDYWRILNMPRWIRKNVSTIIAPSATRLQSICKTYEIPGRISKQVIFNCKRLEHEDRPILLSADAAIKMEELDGWIGKFNSVAIYSGNISEVAYLIELLAAYEKLNGHALLFAGTVAASFQKYFYEKLPKLPNVKFLGALNLQELARVQQLCQIGFCFYNSKYGGELADPAPNKIGDYIAGNLWTIASGQTFIQSVIEPNNLGWALPTVSGDAIEAAVRDIVGRPNFTQPAHIAAYFKSTFNMQVQAEPVIATIL
jgi:hypothetical protein